MNNFGEDACEDCGCDICRCPDDWLIQMKLDEEEKKKRLINTFKEWRKADIEELYLLRTFIITKDLEEEFDKWVSERLENEKK